MRNTFKQLHDTWIHNRVNARQLVIHVDDGVEPLGHLHLHLIRRGLEGYIGGAGVANHLDAD